MFNNFSVSDCGPSSLLVRYHANVGRSNRLETNKHRLEGNAIPAGCKAKCGSPPVELIAISIVIICSIWHSLRSVVYVLENFCRTFANIVAPPIDIATNRLVRCKVSICLTDVENCVQTDP